MSEYNITELNNYVNLNNITNHTNFAGGFIQYDDLNKLQQNSARNHLYIIMSYNVLWQAIIEGQSCNGLINGETACATNIIRHISDLLPDMIGIQEGSTHIIDRIKHKHNIYEGIDGHPGKHVKAIIIYNKNKFTCDNKFYSGTFSKQNGTIDDGRKFIMVILKNIQSREEILFISIHFGHGLSFKEFNGQLTHHIIKSNLLTSSIDRIIVTGDFNLNDTQASAEFGKHFPIRINKFLMNIHDNGIQIKTLGGFTMTSKIIPVILSDYIFDSYPYFYYYNTYYKYFPASDHLPVVAVVPAITKNYINPNPITKLSQPKWFNNSCFAHASLQLLRLITNKVDPVVYTQHLIENICKLKPFGEQHDAFEFIDNFIKAQDIELTSLFLSALKYRSTTVSSYSCGTRSITLGQIEVTINMELTHSTRNALITIDTISGTHCDKHLYANETNNKQIFITHSSNYLLFRLMRFKHDEFDKKKTIKKTDKFSVTPTIIVDKKKYMCIAIIIHTGLSAAAGHYYTYLTPDDKQWYKADDNNMSGITGNSVAYQSINLSDTAVVDDIAHNCYVLLYKYSMDATEAENAEFYKLSDPGQNDGTVKNTILIQNAKFILGDNTTDMSHVDFYNKYKEYNIFYLTNGCNNQLAPGWGGTNLTITNIAKEYFDPNKITVVYEPNFVELHINVPELKQPEQKVTHAMRSLSNKFPGTVFFSNHVHHITDTTTINGVYHIKGIDWNLLKLSTSITEQDTEKLVVEYYTHVLNGLFSQKFGLGY